MIKTFWLWIYLFQKPCSISQTIKLQLCCWFRAHLLADTLKVEGECVCMCFYVSLFVISGWMRVSE